MKATHIWSKKDSLVLSYRDENGVLQFKYPPKRYCAYMRSVPPGLMSDAAVIGYEKEGDWVRIDFRDYEPRKLWLERHKHLDVREGDFSPVKRLLADHEIEIQRPRRIYVDIETDSRKRVEQAIMGEARILMIALVDEYNNRWQWVLEADSDDAEFLLLSAFWEVLRDYDQVVGWNSDNFDRLVIEERSKRYKIWPDRRLMWLDQMVCYKRMSLQVAGSGEEKQSMALNAVAMAVTGQGKHDFDTAHAYEEWLAGGERRARMAAYNMQDVLLLPLIESATKYLEAFQTICSICHVFSVTHSLKPTPQIDGYLARFVQKRSDRLPTRYEATDGDDEDQIEGAYVMPPTRTGILENVHVADFASLYPSIMRSLNLCWTTKTTDGGGIAPGTNVRFRQDIDGHIPLMLAEFTDKRSFWKKKKDAATPGTAEWWEAERFQNGFKVLSNAAFGIQANKHSRYFDPQVAESITLAGQFLIKAVNVEAEKRGMVVLYNDTDSCMIMNCSADQFSALVDYCNKELFPALLRERGFTRNFIQLDFVETFARLIFPVSDGEPVAKRYCGRFSRWKGRALSDMEYACEIKGLELKRGDSSRLTRRMQEEAIALLLGGWSYLKGETLEDQLEALVSDWRRIITIEPLELDDIVVSKDVKPPDAYVRVDKNGRPKDLPPHVKIAVEMLERGEAYPYRARYIVTDGDSSPKKIIPAADYRGECDRRYIWERTYSATMRLLCGACSTKNWAHWKIRKPKKPLAGQLSLGL